MQMDFLNFLKELEKFKSIAITAPSPPDGDSVGTQCALYEILLTLYPQKKVHIINEDPCPIKYSFLSHADKFQISNNVSDCPEYWICVDGGPNRLGEHTTQLWKKAKAHALIDHHATAPALSDFKAALYDPTAAATTQIVYKLWAESKMALTQTIAEALYVGLVYDTGVFKHSNTTPEVMRIAASLLETGFAHTESIEKSMLMRTDANIHMIKSLLNSFKKEFSGRWVWSAIDQKNFISSQGNSEDKDGLIDFLFLIPGCEIAVLFFESKPNVWKLSLRSRGWDVAALAKSLNPQGGGHKLASGCTLEGSFDQAYKLCHKAIEKYLMT
jgi:phosphoesterase RecJ-like protein